MNFSTKLTLATVLAASVATSAFAVDYTTMRNNERVHRDLLAASMAYIIKENCPTISIRKFALFGKVMRLRSYAKGLGYSGSEVDAYVNSDVEQKRFRAIATPMLVKNGADLKNPASFCAVGKDEIAKKSLVGSMIKAR